MKYTLFAVLFLVITTLRTQALSRHHFQTTQKRPWIFFDLGETLIKKQDTGKFKSTLGAHQYLENLKKAGFKLGLISNIPESFGKNYDQKLATLKGLVAKKWGEKDKFNWELFDEILLPLNDKERKPSPILFVRAKSIAKNCPLIFVGENQLEIKAANSLGLSTYHLNTKKPQFLSQKQIQHSFQETYSLRNIINCH